MRRTPSSPGDSSGHAVEPSALTLFGLAFEVFHLRVVVPSAVRVFLSAVGLAASLVDLSAAVLAVSGGRLTAVVMVRFGGVLVVLGVDRSVVFVVMVQEGELEMLASVGMAVLLLLLVVMCVAGNFPLELGDPRQMGVVLRNLYLQNLASRWWRLRWR